MPNSHSRQLLPLLRIDPSTVHGKPFGLVPLAIRTLCCLMHLAVADGASTSSAATTVSRRSGRARIGAYYSGHGGK